MEVRQKMNLRDFKWSQGEKKIARAAFDKAYLNEMKDIADQLRKRYKHIDEPKQIWSIHDYLTDRRRDVDRKYDYRYSELLIVFARLMSDGFLIEKDLEGLSEDKIKAIRSASGSMR
jgi:hypothetical protein